MRIAVSALALAAGLASAQAADPPAPVPGLDKINHIVVIYLENRSFDNLYSAFPGADGFSQAGPIPLQVDKSGVPYPVLPPVLNTNLKPEGTPDKRFPTDLPNAPFHAEPYIDLSQTSGDAVHRFYQEQLQIDGGKMDKFVAWTDAGSLVMSYFNGAKAPLWNIAKQYTLMDHFHHAAFGGSFLNHVYMICACAPKFPNAPKEMVAQLDDNGGLVKDGAVTPDGYAVNTVYSVGGPFPANYPKERLMPLQTDATIGDRLDAKGIDWAWYSGGWDDTLAGHPDPLFQYHHQAFAYFANYAIGAPGQKAHLKDEADFIDGIEKGQLPAVAFFKPVGEDNEHPGYSSVLAGEYHTALLIDLIRRSPLWKDTAILVTYDENGGMWDHVAPPQIDKWGPGVRVPTILVSPYARKGFVDHTAMDTTAVLKLIETRWGLAPLGTRDAASGDMTEAFDFNQ